MIYYTKAPLPSNIRIVNLYKPSQYITCSNICEALSKVPFIVAAFQRLVVPSWNKSKYSYCKQVNKLMAGQSLSQNLPEFIISKHLFGPLNECRFAFSEYVDDIYIYVRKTIKTSTATQTKVYAEESLVLDQTKYDFNLLDCIINYQYFNKWTIDKEGALQKKELLCLPLLLILKINSRCTFNINEIQIGPTINGEFGLYKMMSGVILNGNKPIKSNETSLQSIESAEFIVLQFIKSICPQNK